MFAGTFFLPLLSLVVAGPGLAATTIVRIDGMTFKQPKLEVAVGDTVVWENKDLVPHTVTSKTKAFDSGAILPDGEGAKSTWRRTFRKKGDFKYGCTFHPTMSGEIVVK